MARAKAVRRYGSMRSLLSRQSSGKSPWQASGQPMQQPWSAGLLEKGLTRQDALAYVSRCLKRRTHWYKAEGFLRLFHFSAEELLENGVSMETVAVLEKKHLIQM